MNETENIVTVKSQNLISFQSRSKNHKNEMETDLVPFPLNIIHIDNPKSNLLFKRKKKVQLKIQQKINMRRSFTSDTSKFRTHKFNKSLTSDANKRQMNDELRFSDRQIISGSSEDTKVSNFKPKIRYIVNEEKKQDQNQELLKLQKVEEQNKQQQIQQKFQRHKIQVEIQAPPVNKQRQSMTKKQRRSVLPQIKKNPISSHSFRQKFQFHHKKENDEELQGWALNPPNDQHDKKVDIIEYTRRSLAFTPQKHKKR